MKKQVARRAMEHIKVLNTKNTLGEGAFGVVLRSGDGSRAYKLFRRVGDKPGEYGRLLFESELRAYQIAHSDTRVARHVPAFYGGATIEKLIDPERGDLSEHFHLEHCIVMERIHGEDRKLGPHGGDRHPHVCRIVDRLHRVDVLFTEDISVFFRDDPDKFKIIDFGMRDPTEGAFLQKILALMR